MIQEEQEEPLVNMNLKDFILTVASRSPSPGGGSVAALSASLVNCFPGNSYSHSIH